MYYTINHNQSVNHNAIKLAAKKACDLSFCGPESPASDMQ